MASDGFVIKDLKGKELLQNSLKYIRENLFVEFPIIKPHTKQSKFVALNEIS